MPLVEERRSLLVDGALAGVMLVVVLAPQLAGGTHAVAQAALSGVALAGAAAFVASRTRRSPCRVTLFALPIAAGLGLTLLSLAPLPSALLRLLSPEAHERLARARELLPPESAALVGNALSFDAPDSSLAAVRLAAALAVVVVVGHACRHRRERRVVYRALLAGGAALVVVAVGHRVAHAESIWGVVPAHTYFTLYAPLPNTNHLGKLFGAFALLCVGRGLSIRRGREAALFVAVGAACGVALFLTSSRGSMLAFVVGAAALVVLASQRARQRAAADAPSLIAPFAAVALIACGALLAAGDGIARELQTLAPSLLSSTKIAMWGPTWRFVVDHAPALGSGNGAFGVAFPAALEPGVLDAGRFVYTHAENLVLQSLADHGVVGGGALLALAVALVVVAVRSRATAVDVAPAATLAFLLAGDVVDFALEIPAGLFVAAAALGLLGARLEQRFVEVPLRAAAPALTALVVVVAACAWSGVAHSRKRIDASLLALPAADDAAALAARRALLERAFARHSSDGHYAYGLAVAERQRRNPRGALRWAGRALALWPAHRGAHIEAARALAALGRPEQAAIEYKAAWIAGRGDKEILDEIVGRWPGYALRRAAVPTQPRALETLCIRLRDDGALDDAQRCLDELVALPGASRWMGASLELALKRGDPGGARRRVEEWATARLLDDDAAARAAAVLARVSSPEDALATTAAWLGWLHHPLPLLEWRFDAQLTARRFDEAGQTLAAVRRAPAPSAASTAGPDLVALRLEARLARAQGDLAAARVALERLSERRPRDVDALLDLADVEIALDLVLPAEQTLARAERLQPQHPRLAPLRRRLIGGAHPAPSTNAPSTPPDSER